MANMSYCRFYNTTLDLEECVDVLENDEYKNLSTEEKHSSSQLYDLAQQYIAQYGRVMEEIDDDDDIGD
jgi:hypothetical protein